MGDGSPWHPAPDTLWHPAQRPAGGGSPCPCSNPTHLHVCLPPERWGQEGGGRQQQRPRLCTARQRRAAKSAWPRPGSMQSPQVGPAQGGQSGGRVWAQGVEGLGIRVWARPSRGACVWGGLDKLTRGCGLGSTPGWWENRGETVQGGPEWSVGGGV